jgi:hypothetical protein
MRTFDRIVNSDNVVNDWNMVGGYYDLLHKLLSHYYETSFTPDLSDDLEAIKRVYDHSYCKIRHHKLVVDSDVDTKAVDWFTKEFDEIENILTEIMLFESGRRGGFDVHKPNFRLMKLKSDVKRRICNIHRFIMVAHQNMGDFSKERKVKGVDDFLKDIE